jgi:hypothetical protein
MSSSILSFIGARAMSSVNSNVTRNPLPTGLALRPLEPDATHIAEYVRRFLETVALHGRGALRGARRPAAIFDIDGTILSASPVASTPLGVGGGGGGPSTDSFSCSLLVREIALHCQRAGCTIFIVTARPEWGNASEAAYSRANSPGMESYNRAHTIAQLRQCGYFARTGGAAPAPRATGTPIVYEELYMLPHRREDGNFNDFKARLRQDILAQQYNVMLNIGDQWDDLFDGRFSPGAQILTSLNARIDTQSSYWSFSAPFDAALLSIKVPAEGMVPPRYVTTSATMGR